MTHKLGCERDMFWLLDTFACLVKIGLYTLWYGVFSLLPRIRKSNVPPDFSADVCLVTGAAGGLGREIALKFAESGATLVLWDIKEDKLKAVADEMCGKGVEVHYYICDCSKKEDVRRTADLVREEVGDVAILINNAGIVHGKSILESSEAEIQKVMEVNAQGYFWTIKEFLPWMTKNNYGYIVSIASVLGFCGVRGVADYCASKAAVVNFTEALRYEMSVSGKSGITVCCICPYHINTGMFEGVKTKFPRLLPPLEPSLVAERVIQAVIKKEALVIIPGFLQLMVLLKWVLPVKAFTEVLNLIGANDAMKFFIGHTKKK